METSALIFIPDISGYTKFITETESRHSKHIITELLEVIIESNKLNMQVSEIEGDAVLFYRKGEPPTIDELLSQVKSMFIDFHTQLKIIQRDNVCQCGACRTAINLSLKFISHFGILEEVTVQNFTKIMGSDVILAHRLLKNNIPDTEYFLITENYYTNLDLVNKNFETGISFEKHTENFQNFNEINIYYTSLSNIKKDVPAINGLDKKKEHYSSFDNHIYISAPLMLVHELLTDQAAKLNYVPGLTELRNSNSINRINRSHTCVFDDLEIHFVTRSNEVREKEISYIEEGNVNIGIAFVSNYVLKEEKTGTKLLQKIIPGAPGKNYSFMKRMLIRFKSKAAVIKLRKTNRKNLELFKAYCEKVAVERGC